MERKKWRGTCCVASNCSNRQGKRSDANSSDRDVDITFHRFPANDELCGEWVTAINRQNFVPTPSSRICSLHFEETDFTASKTRRRLKESAIPSIFNCTPHLQAKTKTPGKRSPPSPNKLRKDLCMLDHPYFCPP